MRAKIIIWLALLSLYPPCSIAKGWMDEPLTWSGFFSMCLYPTNPANPPSPKCKIADNNWWKNPKEAQDGLHQLFQPQWFVVFNATLEKLDQDKNLFENGEIKSTGIYEGLNAITLIDNRFEEQKSSFTKARIDQFIAALPESPYAPLLKASLDYSIAVNIRKQCECDIKSPEYSFQHKYYQRALHKAETELVNASPATKELPSYHALLLSVIAEEDNPQTETAISFSDAIKRWPNFYLLYEILASRLVPAMGGSAEEVETALKGWINDPAAANDKTLYARIYIYLNNHDLRAADSAITWPLMKESLRTLAYSYYTKEFMNYRASYSCLAKDGDEFKISMDELTPRNLDARYWPNGYTYPSCLNLGTK